MPKLLYSSSVCKSIEINSPLLKLKNTVYIYSMPALKISNRFGLTHILPIPCGQKVPVRQKSGKVADVDFAGFICQKGATVFPWAKFVKIMAAGALKNNSSGYRDDDTRYLSSDRGEYVVGLMMERPPGSGKVGVCVYGVLDDDGWPMVRGQGDAMPTSEVA